MSSPLSPPHGAVAPSHLTATLAPTWSTFSLSVAQDARRPLALAWFALGCFAVLASGLFSVLLVLSRTPQLQFLLPVADFFRVTLVVHVDLSVLVWFLAFAGGVWTLGGSARAIALGWSAFVAAALGTVVLCLAPFVQNATPVMSNYVPVLDGSVFLGGLLLFALGMVLLCVRAVLAMEAGHSDGAAAMRFGLSASMVAVAVAVVCFVWSGLQLPRSLDPRIYYELLFWGGGHVLQFGYTLLMLVAWLWLASATGARVPLTPRLVALLFGLALIGVFLTPMTYLAYPVTSVEHHQWQTLLMRYGGGLVIPPIGLAVVWSMLAPRPFTPAQWPLATSLLASLVLFCAGGIIGFLISGNNVRIPAHYHGCIVGVTLAMMGVIYRLLPEFGMAAADTRLALWQPIVYGVGQLMHIVGLVWSGGYGVQRKVAGADQVLRTTQETLGMGLMGLGGLVAIIGGVLFLVVVLTSVRRAVRSSGGVHGR